MSGTAFALGSLSPCTAVGIGVLPAHPLVPPPPDPGVGGRGGPRRPPPRAMADRDDLRSVPWRAASSSASRILARSPWQSSGRRPAAVVPRTCSTPYLRYPAPQNAGQPGGQCRRHPCPGALRALLFRAGAAPKGGPGLGVSSSAACLDVSPSRTVSQRLSESKSLRLSAPSVSPCMFWGSGMAPRWPASGDRRYYRFVRAWKFGSCHQYRSPLPSHTAPHPCISLEAATCIQLLRNRSCCIKPPAR